MTDGAAARLMSPPRGWSLQATARRSRSIPCPTIFRCCFADGGLVPHLKKRFAKERNKEQGQCAEHRP
ncbi:MAG: hypothetical protein HPM95_11005 [Alphaproteobacteria bacterium]|nr:hypothetical protein [Alphaproteobacteria bacterium]